MRAAKNRGLPEDITRDEIGIYQEDPRSQKRDVGHPHLVRRRPWGPQVYYGLNPVSTVSVGSAWGFSTAGLRRRFLGGAADFLVVSGAGATISGFQAGSGMASTLSRPSATRIRKSWALKHLPSGARTRG